MIANAIEKSANGKLGGISTTYASINSCPNACPFKKSGACYGMSGPISWQWAKLNKDKKATPREVAIAEAKAIDGLSGRNTLRIHTLGDCQTDLSARIVSAAAERYMERGGKLAYTYTHAWRKVARASWGKVSVLASCETEQDVKDAKARGYATAMVVREFPQESAYRVGGVKVVPCPEQTGRSKSCEDCQLCYNDKKIAGADFTVGFASHGPTKKMAAALAGKGV